MLLPWEGVMCPPKYEGCCMCTFPRLISHYAVINMPSLCQATNTNCSSSCSLSETWVLLGVCHCPDVACQSCWHSAPPRWCLCDGALRWRRTDLRRQSRQMSRTKALKPLSWHGGDPFGAGRTVEQKAPPRKQRHHTLGWEWRKG